MRWPPRVLILSTLTAALATGSFAQRGGFSQRGLPAYPAVPSSTAIGMGSAGGIHPTGFGYSSGYGGYGGRTGVGSSRGNLNNRRGGDYRRVPSGYFFSPYLYPFLDYGSAPYGGAPDDPPYDPNADYQAMAQNAIGLQLQRLTAEVQQMKFDQQAQSPLVAAVPQPAPPPAPPITIVLRNGQQLQVQNYAVMGATLWDFSNQPARKIPVSNIDVEASAKASSASGADFPQLSTTTPTP